MSSGNNGKTFNIEKKLAVLEATYFKSSNNERNAGLAVTEAALLLLWNEMQFWA